MFDPLTTQETGEKGGIGTENIQSNAIKDNLIGNRTISPGSISRANFKRTGTLNFLLNMISALIQEMKGTNYFDDEVIINLKQIDEAIKDLLNTKADKTYVDNKDVNLQNQITANSDNISNLSISKADKLYVDNKDVNLQNQITANGSNISLLNDEKTRIESKIDNHRNSIDHNNLYYTKDELMPFLKGGETIKKEEVYTIINPNNGDGTFSYTYKEELYIGQLTEDGNHSFTLKKGEYILYSNCIEVMINDTLRRNFESGGLIEIDSKNFFCQM